MNRFTTQPQQPLLKPAVHSAAFWRALILPLVFPLVLPVLVPAIFPVVFPAVFVAAGLATSASAGEPGGFFHSLAAPVRALHRKKPATCRDPAVDRLIDEFDWVDNQIRSYGSIVAQHPDVWGQNRLTRHRAEFEEQMRAQLDGFRELNNASLRRSDQAFLGLALSMDASDPASSRAAATRPTAATASITNLISNPVGGGTAAEAVIARTPPFAATAQPFASFGLDSANAVSLEPTIHLDHLARYLNHLHELRRINEGDDIADSPGYSLNLVRIPVSVTPGQLTDAGHGAEITVTADPQLGDDLLPITFRSLVINDIVDLLAPGLTFAVNAPAVRESLRSPDAAEPAAAAMLGMRSRSVSVPTTKMRRARMPIPPEQLVDVIGPRQLAILLRNTLEALAADPANTPCIHYSSVRGFLAEELAAAADFLAQPRQLHVWAQLPEWNLGELIRSRRTGELELRRRGFFDSLGIDEPAPADPLEAPLDDPLHDGAPTAPCLRSCANATAACRICRTTTAVLAWAILVESALLDERLAEDIRETGTARSAGPGFTAGPGCSAGPFYGPQPGPEARAAFNDYVRRRWPIRVFALDPVTQEQNVEDQFAQRREMQLAMAMAYASGRANGQALARYARRLETDLATIALNKTAVGFTHGADTFGWRFYPRMQSPPTRGSLATLTDTLCGSSPSHRDLASRRLEPGMRECTAIVVMPSFVPLVAFDVKTCWFSLTHPKATEQNMRQSLRLSRSVKSMQQTAAHCIRCGGCDRDGEIAHILRSIEKLDRQLPLQTMLAQIPHENTAGGFELFNTGISDLAPELIGWYGAQGVDPAGTTVVFLLGKGFSVHDTSVIAGGRPVKTTLLGRQLLRAEIPPGVQTILPAGDCSTMAGTMAGTMARSTARSAAAAGRRPHSIRLTSNAEPLPAPADRPSLRLTLPAGETPAGGLASGCGCDPAAGCLQADCHAREVVDVQLATPHGVSGHLLIPVVGSRSTAQDHCGLAIASRTVVRLTATRTKAGTWRVNEFFESTPDAIRIAAPAVFAPPAKAGVNFVLRDDATGMTAGVFSIPAPPFDARAEQYVLAGADLRNFVGDTSRPATDKTLRGAIKPYLDSLASATAKDARSPAALSLSLAAELVTEEKTIPIEGTIGVEVRETNQASDLVDPTSGSTDPATTP